MTDYLINYHTVEKYGGVEGELVNFMPQLLYTGGPGPSTHRIRGLVGPEFSLNAVMKRRTFTPPEIEPDLWVVEHVA